MTTQTIVEALRALAAGCPDGYQTLIQDGGIEPTPIEVVIEEIEQDGEEIEVADWAVDAPDAPFAGNGGITLINEDGYRESIRTYRVVRGSSDVLADIRAWDHEDVEDLQNLIREYERICTITGREPEHGLDYTSLPSESFPDDFDTVEKWALDKHGRYLWGSTVADASVEVLK